MSHNLFVKRASSSNRKWGIIILSNLRAIAELQPSSHDFWQTYLTRMSGAVLQIYCVIQFLQFIFMDYQAVLFYQSDAQQNNYSVYSCYLSSLLLWIFDVRNKLDHLEGFFFLSKAFQWTASQIVLSSTYSSQQSRAPQFHRNYGLDGWVIAVRSWVSWWQKVSSSALFNVYDALGREVTF